MMPDGYQYLNPRQPRVMHDHVVELIKTIRERDRAKLNDWEKRFLISIITFDHPTQRQVETVRMICGKALALGGPRRSPRRRRGAGR